MFDALERVAIGSQQFDCILVLFIFIFFFFLFRVHGLRFFFSFSFLMSPFSNRIESFSCVQCYIFFFLLTGQMVESICCRTWVEVDVCNVTHFWSIYRRISLLINRDCILCTLNLSVIAWKPGVIPEATFLLPKRTE